MRNIEFKAELRDIDAAREQCRNLGAMLVARCRQTDTYYRLTDGRLKRRSSDNEATMWHFYHRPNRIQPCVSNYSVLTESQAVRRWGVQSLREWVTVKKTREIWLFRNVRIHLDQVENLGTYLEFDAAVTNDCSIQSCQSAISELREVFGPILGEPVAVSYSDLIEQEVAEQP